MGRKVLIVFFLTVAGYGIPPAGAQPQIPATSDDVVVLARRFLVLQAGTRHAGGQIAVNDADGKTIARSFKTLSVLQPSLLSDIVIARQAGIGWPTEFYDLFSNRYTDLSGAALISGTGPVPIASEDFPLFAFPAPVTVSPGATDVVVRGDEILTLTAGNYGRIRLRKRATLFMEGGTYNVRSLVTGIGSIIRFNGPTTLNVEDRIRLGGRTSFKPIESDPPLNTRCVVINTAGTRARFDRSSVVSATLNAPNARLILGRGGVFRGNFTADRIRVGNNAVLEVESPLTTPCP